MKIVVLNGSPKGKYSITMQYISFLQKQFPMHDYKTIHVARRIKAIEKNEVAFSAIIDDIQSADMVLWSFGVWVLAVSAQTMRFIELISERGVEDAFRGKYTAAISTSINYFDHTAHNYMRSVCEDLGMQFVDSMSLDIMDLRNEEKRQQLIVFADSLFRAVETKAASSCFNCPLLFNSFEYQPGSTRNSIKTDGKKVLVLTDKYEKDTNLGMMIDRFRQSFVGPIDLIDLNDIDIRGACLGCMKCGYDYQCQYKDGFVDFYNNKVRMADIIILAGDLKGRYLSSLWKTFFDRAFFWNHTPSLARKQMAYLISGPLSQNSNLIQILEASVTARQNANFVDIITDECENSGQIDAQLDGLAERMIRMAKIQYVKPQNFLAVGGHKVFRDNIWGRLRCLWQADHRFYKKNGYYDFPQNDHKFRIIGPILMALTKIPTFRKKYYDNVKKMPALRFARLIEKSDNV